MIGLEKKIKNRRRWDTDGWIVRHNMRLSAVTRHCDCSVMHIIFDFVVDAACIALQLLSSVWLLVYGSRAGGMQPRHVCRGSELKFTLTFTCPIEQFVVNVLFYQQVYFILFVPFFFFLYSFSCVVFSCFSLSLFFQSIMNIYTRLFEDVPCGKKILLSTLATSKKEKWLGGWKWEKDKKK